MTKKDVPPPGEIDAFTVDVYGDTSEAMHQRSRSIINQVMEEARTPKKAAGKG